MTGKSDKRRRDSGVTLVETMISMVVFAGVMALTYSTVVVVHSVNTQGEAESRQVISYRHTLATLRSELRYATTENDPRTNKPRFQIHEHRSGKQTFEYQQLVGARVVSGEMQPVWSSPITIDLDDEGRVVRSEGRDRRILGTGVKELAFEATANGRFLVTCVTSWRNPKNGKVRDVRHRLYIKPSN